MKHLIYFLVFLGAISCQQKVEKKEDSKETKTKTEVKIQEEATSPVNDKLAEKGKVEIEGNLYREYYANSTVIKFQGPQDEEGKRNGTWSYFSPEGVELSMTTYEHGKKHGQSIVKYPSGAIFYLGEYENDQQIGVWKTYAEDGTLKTVKDYGSSK